MCGNINQLKKGCKSIKAGVILELAEGMKGHVGALWTFLIPKYHHLLLQTQSFVLPQAVRKDRGLK